MERLVLLDKLCEYCEDCSSDTDSEEVMRIVRAVTDGGHAVILKGGPVATIVESKFPKDNLIWSHISIEELDFDQGCA